MKTSFKNSVSKSSVRIILIQYCNKNLLEGFSFSFPSGFSMLFAPQSASVWSQFELREFCQAVWLSLIWMNAFWGVQTGSSGLEGFSGVVIVFMLSVTVKVMLEKFRQAYDFKDKKFIETTFYSFHHSLFSLGQWTWCINL